MVDVGIPAHGRPRYVLEAIESVLAQTFSDWRLTVSEDGAEDAGIGAAVAPYLEDRRVRHVRLGRQVGPAANMSELVRSGDAPYVALLHDDDRWEPEFLERRVAFMERHRDCAYVFSGHVDIDLAGRVTGRSQLWLPEGSHSPAEFFPKLLGSNQIATPTVLVRRSAYAACGEEFDARFATIHDWEMWLRLAARFPVGYLAVWDAAYRTHPEQISRRRGTAAEFMQLMEHGERLAQEAGIRLPERARRRQRAALLLSAALDELEADRGRAAVSRLRHSLRVWPPALADRRVPALLAGLALGRPGRRAVARARAAVYRRRGPDLPAPGR